MIGLPSLHALDGAQGPRIWLAAEAADMRCGFDRLAERVKAVIGQDPLGGLLGAKKREKGGEGVFFAGIASYVVDGVDVGRWLPVCFCALLRHFSRRFGEGRAAWAKARTGLAFVVSHPCLANSKYGQGHGKDGASGGCDDFSEIFLHGCSLRTTTSIVRFWELIARKVFPAHFGEVSGLFCWV